MNLKRLYFFILLVGVFPFGAYELIAGPNPSALNAPGKYLLENKGQVTDQSGNPRKDIDFRLAGKGLTMFVGNGQLHYQWAARASDVSSKDPAKFSMYRMDVELLGADKNAKVITEQREPYYEQYYTSAAAGAVAFTFKKITYLNVYPGIDWVLYIKDDVVEYDFIIHPGGNVEDIKIAYKGASLLRLNTDGSLTAATPMGSVTENAPHSIQGDGAAVPSRFILSGNVLSFKTGAYKGALTIDPTLSWASYFGGSDFDECMGVTTDPSGNAYATGLTLSLANIATTGSFQTTYGGSNLLAQAGDAYLARYNCSGTLAWTTYFGGTAGERGWSLVTDKFGAVYVAGFVNSNGGLPASSISTPGSHQPVFGGGDADLFLAKFNSSGQRTWSTYYGGTGNEGITGPYMPCGLACDTAGNVFLSGTTNSTAGIATPGSFQPALAGGFDAFLVKFSSAGVRTWASYLGGASDEKGNAIAIDKAGNSYLAGTTNSMAGINSSGFQPTYGGGTADAFLTKFNNSGQQQWSTYYGGTNTDEGHGLACDTAGNIFFAGRTKSLAGISSPGAFQQVNKGGLWDAFLVKFNTAGLRQFGTYYGGIHQGSVIGFSCLTGDNAGNIYLAGLARDLDTLATAGSYQPTNGGLDDGLLAKFSNTGQRLWSTYYGGAGTDMINAVTCDQFGNIYAAGRTSSTSAISSANGAQPTYGGGDYDGFILKFNEASNTPKADTIWGPKSVCLGATNKYHITPIPGATSYSWTIPSGWSGTSTTDSITITAHGSTDTIRVTPNFTCGTGALQMLIVDVSPAAQSTAQGPLAFCSGDSVILKANTTHVTGWQWLSNGTTITGAIDSTLAIHQPGIYAVITTTTNQCIDTSLTDTVTVHPLPQPVITRNNNDLSTGTYITYQWNHNNTPITGATTQTYTMLLFTDDYSVTVTDSNGCASTSQLYIPTAIGDVTQADQVTIYPNPATDHLTINAPFPVRLTITTAEGKTIENQTNPTTIDLTHLANGLYLINIYSKNGDLIKSERIIKSKTD